MKTLKNTILLSLLSLTLLTSCAQMSPSVVAQTGIAHNNHDVLVTHYENLAKEAKSGLQANKKALKEYEAHSCYYGTQGQNLRSHSSANIHKYEKDLKENLRQADFHRKMLIEQNPPINKTEVDLQLEFIGAKLVHPSKEL
jgi:hypothetical protein